MFGTDRSSVPFITLRNRTALEYGTSWHNIEKRPFPCVYFAYRAVFLVDQLRESFETAKHAPDFGRFQRDVSFKRYQEAV